jgi:AcrR family transcriptional regulator
LKGCLYWRLCSIRNGEYRTMPQAAASKPSKKTQERTEATRAKLLEAATSLFSGKGYEGVTVSDIEKSAGVHRGLASYHYGDKASLWRAVASASFNQMRDEFQQRLKLLKEVSPQERLALIVRFYVHFNAKHPEVSALMSQEARQKTWRIQYLIDNHVKPACDSMEELARETLGMDREAFMHWYYIMISASSTLFYFAPECEMLFDVDSRSPEVVEKHAELLVSMLVKPGYLPLKDRP